MELRALKQKRWLCKVEKMGARRKDLSKANNHSGAEEEYYIRTANQYHITSSMGVYKKLIKLIIFDATIAVSFAVVLDKTYCSITRAVRLK